MTDDRTDAPGDDSARAPSGQRRNPGADLRLDWALDTPLDEDEIGRSIADLPGRAATPPEETELLLLAIRCIDLTTLAGDDTPERVRRLCARAREPLDGALAQGLGASAERLRTAAVCVYHHFLPVAREALAGSGVPVAVVSAGFPAGLSPLRQRIDEVRASADAGADEIDAVINRSHVLAGEWGALYDEVRAFREEAGEARLKIILATGELRTATNVARASRICLLAGADFIKTSTGKEAVNATYAAGVVMMRAIRDYRTLTGHAAGFKPAGGIRSPAQALEWIRLVRDELGDEWLTPERFRFGASSLLEEIVRRLQQRVSGAPPEGRARGSASGDTTPSGY